MDTNYWLAKIEEIKDKKDLKSLEAIVVYSALAKLYSVK